MSTNKKIFIALTALFITLITLCQGIGEKDWRKNPDPIMASVMVEKFVKEKLKSPSTAEFPSYSSIEKNIKYVGNQTYTINSYVDSQNSFGAMIRTYFIATIKQTDTELWRLLNLKFL